MTQDEILRKILIEDDISNFRDFFDKEWITKINGIVENTSIDSVVGNFAVSWWGSARAFVLPWLLVTGISDVLNELIPNPFEVAPTPTPQKAWEEYLKHNEFHVALWKLSENVYCSLFFAYENLIVNILKEITGTPIRITRKSDFKKKLRDTYDQEIAHKIWHQTLMQSARETRNSIVHNGGKATKDLLKVKPLPNYIQDDDVVISALVTRKLQNDLKPLVQEFVEKSVELIK